MSSVSTLVSSSLTFISRSQCSTLVVTTADSDWVQDQHNPSAVTTNHKNTWVWQQLSAWH